MSGKVALVGAALLVGAAAPSPKAELVLNCYLTQSGDLGMGQFVRHLQIFPDRGIVSIADGVRGAPPTYVGAGRLVAFDAKHVVYDFASPRSGGRTEIDRTTGVLTYRGDRAAVSGTCQPSEL